MTFVHLLFNEINWSDFWSIGPFPVPVRSLVLLELLCPFMSHSLIRPSCPPEARRFESLLQVKHWRLSLWPFNSLKSSDEPKSQIFIRRSSPPEARYFPSGEKDRHEILPLWPLNTRTWKIKDNFIEKLLTQKNWIWPNFDYEIVSPIT